MQTLILCMIFLNSKKFFRFSINFLYNNDNCFKNRSLIVEWDSTTENNHPKMSRTTRLARDSVYTSLLSSLQTKIVHFKKGKERAYRRRRRLRDVCLNCFRVMKSLSVSNEERAVRLCARRILTASCRRKSWLSS